MSRLLLILFLAVRISLVAQENKPFPIALSYGMGHNPSFAISANLALSNRFEPFVGLEQPIVAHLAFHIGARTFFPLKSKFQVYGGFKYVNRFGNRETHFNDDGSFVRNNNVPASTYLVERNQFYTPLIGVRWNNQQEIPFVGKWLFQNCALSLEFSYQFAHESKQAILVSGISNEKLERKIDRNTAGGIGIHFGGTFYLSRRK